MTISRTPPTSRLIIPLLLWLLAMPASAITLKIATLAPDGTQWMTTFRQAAEEIKRETGGRVQLRYYPGGVMGDDKSVLRKIRIGQLHGGALSSGGMANIHADTQIYSIPFAFDNYAEVDRVRAALDGLVLDKLRQGGFVGYGISEGGFAYMMSEQPITNLEQARRSKVWVPEGDRISRIALESLGISPVPLPLSDVLTGLQTGLIDAVSGPPSGAIALQWHTRVKHLTDAPLLYTYGTLVVSEKALAQLGEVDRKVLEDKFAQALERINRASRDDNRAALEALKKQGVKIDPANTGEIAHWRSIINPAIEGMSGDRAISKDLLQRLHGLIDSLRKP
jgi:TRAP-type C4-dicarboxylate transport system substrate-binding protein